MNKKLFTKRLGISLLWVLSPVAFITAGVVVDNLFGAMVVLYILSAMTLISFALYVYMVLDRFEVLDDYTNWLKGKDGKPD